jgi:hypothetical protein
MLVKGSKGFGMWELIYYIFFWLFRTVGEKNYGETRSLSPINLALNTTSWRPVRVESRSFGGDEG